MLLIWAHVLLLFLTVQGYVHRAYSVLCCFTLLLVGYNKLSVRHCYPVMYILCFYVVITKTTSLIFAQIWFPLSGTLSHHICKIFQPPTWLGGVIPPLTVQCSVFSFYEHSIPEFHPIVLNCHHHTYTERMLHIFRLDCVDCSTEQNLIKLKYFWINWSVEFFALHFWEKLFGGGGISHWQIVSGLCLSLAYHCKVT